MRSMAIIFQRIARSITQMRFHVFPREIVENSFGQLARGGWHSLTNIPRRVGLRDNCGILAGQLVVRRLVCAFSLSLSPFFFHVSSAVRVVKERREKEGGTIGSRV